MSILHELRRRVRRPRPRHSLEHPRPDQRPAVEFDPDRHDDDLDAAEDVLAPHLVALHRAVAAPPAPFPVISRDGWPYNLRSV